MFITSNKNQMLMLDTQLCLAYILSKRLGLPKFYKNFSQALFEKCTNDEIYFIQKNDTYLFLFYKANEAIDVYSVPGVSTTLYDLGSYGKVSYFRKKFFSNSIRKLFSSLFRITFDNERWVQTMKKFGDSSSDHNRAIAELRFKYGEITGISMKETKWMTNEHKALREAILSA